MESKGLRPKADEEALTRQKLELLQQQVKLEQSIVELNQDLQQMLRLETEGNLPIWPSADLCVTGDAVNVDAAIQEGMSRPDLAAALAMRDGLDADTLPAVRSGLGALSPLLGSTPGKSCLLAQFCFRRRAMRVEHAAGTT